MFLFEKLRKGTKIILWITIGAFVGFIFLVWGMDVQRSSGPNPMIVGTVNGQRIQTTYYQQVLRDLYQQYEKQTGGRISESDEASIRRSTWDRLINEILINQELKRRKIVLSDAELEYYIRLSPPPEVAENPAFQTDGQFDPAKYKEILQNPQYDLTGLEAVVRATVPVRKLEELIASSAKVSNNEVRAYFMEANEKADFSYVLARPGMFSVNPDSLPEQDLKSFYNSNPDKFRVPDAANIRYVAATKRASPMDESDVLAEANDLRREALAGSDFAQLATDYSEGPEASKGGDIGALVPKASLPPELAEVAFSLKPGEISSPFSDSKGINLIKLEERKKEGGVEKVRFRRIFLPVSPSAETLSQLQTQIMDVSAKTSKISLQAAAQQAGLEVKETGILYKGESSPALPAEESIRDFGFKNKVGTISKPIETEKAWYILEVAEKIPSHVPPFEDAVPAIRKAMVQQKQDEIARQKLEAVSAKLSQGASLEQAASAAGLSVVTVKDLTRNDPLPELGRQPDMTGAAFALTPGKVSPVLQGGAGFFVIKLDGIKPPDEKLFEAQKAVLKAQILQQKKLIEVSDWLDQMRKSARIQDYRAQVIGA